MTRLRSPKLWTIGVALVGFLRLGMLWREMSLRQSAAGPAGPPPASAEAVKAAARSVPLELPVAEAGPTEPVAAVAAPAVAELPPQVLEFQLPTDNQRLLQRQPEAFFMFVDRYTPAGQIQAWQGGSYGFVRNPRETAQGTVFTKFHEGIDIAPEARDARGEPTDEVRAVADGAVAYVTASSRTSNYGNYVVLLHQVGSAGSFYSLYAHLKEAAVAVGGEVKRGQQIGWLGHTGDGIDRRRAHVHLELGLVLSERFDAFYHRTAALANGHGNYHGSNLIGMDAAAFFTAHQADRYLMPDQFLRKQEVYYKVLVPNRGFELEIVGRYPWLRQPGAAAAAWEISFTGPGVPVAVAPANQTVAFPSVSWVRSFGGYHSWNTRSMLGGSGDSATLTAEGNRYLSLVAGDF